jgi:hypothetical protein
MKKIWEKIKVFFKTTVVPWLKDKIKKLWEIIKKFFIVKVLPWIKKNWFEITNILVLLIIHLLIRNVPNTAFADTILQVWILSTITYYIGIKIKKNYF